MADFLRIARTVAAELGYAGVTDVDVSERAERAMFVCDLDDGAIQHSFANLPRATLEDGIRRSLQDFHEMAVKGVLDFPV